MRTRRTRGRGAQHRRGSGDRFGSEERRSRRTAYSFKMDIGALKAARILEQRRTSAANAGSARAWVLLAAHCRVAVGLAPCIRRDRCEGAGHEVTAGAPGRRSGSPRGSPGAAGAWGGPRMNRLVGLLSEAALLYIGGGWLHCRLRVQSQHPPFWSRLHFRVETGARAVLAWGWRWSSLSVRRGGRIQLTVSVDAVGSLGGWREGESNDRLGDCLRCGSRNSGQPDLFVSPLLGAGAS